MLSTIIASLKPASVFWDGFFPPKGLFDLSALSSNSFIFILSDSGNIFIFLYLKYSYASISTLSKYFSGSSNLSKMNSLLNFFFNISTISLYFLYN